MKCDLQNRHELIADYVTGELSESETETFEAHYFQCQACFEELKIAGEAITLVESEGPAVLPARQSSGRKVLGNLADWLSSFTSPRRWAVVTAALAGVVLALVLLPGRGDKSSVTGLTGPNFQPLPYFEEWISETTRSSGDVIETVISPAIGEKFIGEEITFEWQMREDAPVSLKILTNFEDEVFTATPEQSQFPHYEVQVSPMAFKEAGLYYWRIEDESEVLFVGKFYFLK